jgi:ParB/RepB/Spo0J family partition protein
VTTKTKAAPAEAAPASPAVPEVKMLLLRPHQVRPWAGLNPRTQWSEEKVQGMALSIADHGVQTPISVAEPGSDGSTDGVYLIVAGETRWRGAALAEAGCEEIGLDPVPEVLIPAWVRPYTETEALTAAMVENIQRQDLTAVDEARGYAKLLAENPTWTQAYLAEKILGDAKKQPYVANRLRLLDLPPAALELLQEKVITPSHARDVLMPLLRLPDEQGTEAISRMVSRIRGAEAQGVVITEPWLRETGAAIRAAVEQEMGTVSLFEGLEEAQPSGAAASQDAAEAAPDSAPVEAPRPATEEEQKDAILRHILTSVPAGEWFRMPDAAIATAVQLEDRIDAALAQHPQNRRVDAPDGLGQYIVEAGADRHVTYVAAVSRISRYERSDALLARVRRVMGISIGSPAAPAPAAAASPASSPAALPAPSAEELEEGVDRLLRAALLSDMDLAGVWAEFADGAGATDEEILALVARQAGLAEDGDEGVVPEVGSWRVHGAGTVSILPDASCTFVHLRKADLVARIRRLLSIAAPAAEPLADAGDAPPRLPGPAFFDEMEARFLAGQTAPAPASSAPAPHVLPAPATAPKPAAPPAPAPPAAPVTTLPPAGAGRAELRPGAGLIEAVLTATGGRPCTIGVQPMGTEVFVTVAPRIAKAGETPFALRAPASELDAILVSRIDNHFK